LYLTDALAAIDKVLAYTASGRHGFFSESIVQDAVIRNLETIGEAVKNLTPETRVRHSDVPWAEIAGMRDRLIHGRAAAARLWNPEIGGSALRGGAGRNARCREVKMLANRSCRLLDTNIPAPDRFPPSDVRIPETDRPRFARGGETRDR
jgi:hypothetical protein